jgi:hypothetical protein
VTFQAAVGQDVKDLDSLLDQGAGHQQRSMAIQRIFLRAHQGELVIVGCSNDPLDPTGE